MPVPWAHLAQRFRERHKVDVTPADVLDMRTQILAGAPKDRRGYYIVKLGARHYRVAVRFKNGRPYIMTVLP